ncbi:MAG: hypothetical protein ACQETA_00770 [Bacteroidota bacterium]
MGKSQLQNHFLTGFLAGLLLPVIVFVFIYLFSGDGLSLKEYAVGIARKNVLTHIVSLSVLSNLVIFLLFNRFDKLRSSRGVVGITLLWALTVLAIKLL